MKIKFQLIFLAIGIYGCYLFYGLLQQKIFNTQYTSQTYPPSKFTHASAIGLFQFALGSGITTIYYFIEKNKRIQLKEIPKIEEMPLGIINGLSILFSNSALLYVSYPMQALFKSSKVLGVIIASILNPYSKSDSYKKIKTGLIFTIGVFLFNYFGKQKAGRQNTLYGVFLLLLSLITDGFLPQYQMHFKHKYNQCSSIFLYKLTCQWSLIFFSIIAILSGELKQIFIFLFTRDRFYIDLFLISMAGSIGQFFIFEIIKKYDSYILPIITSSRKILTVMVSLIIFSHDVNFIQLIGILIVFSVIIFELLQSK